MKELAKAALIQGGVQDPSDDQIVILSTLMVRYVQQQVKGLEKYNIPINPMSDHDWLEMKLEEHIDGSVYTICENIQMMIKKQQLQKADDVTRKLAAAINAGEISMDQVSWLLEKKRS